MDNDLLITAATAPDRARLGVAGGRGPRRSGPDHGAGASALSQADIILYDALVDRQRCWRWRAGEKIYAGKRAGVRAASRTKSPTLLVTLAKEGKRVLRLKGGDPFVFGRGGEEAQALARAGVPFRIVPGITAGIGGLAYAGIPVTHRDTNHAVTFITGHGVDGKLTKLDWAAVSRGAPTLVLYMARKFAGEIAQALLAAGRPAGRTRRHRRQCGAPRPAGDHHHPGRPGAAAENAPALAIIVIGENVKLARRAQLAGLNALEACRQFFHHRPTLGIGHAVPVPDFLPACGRSPGTARFRDHRCRF